MPPTNVPEFVARVQRSPSLRFLFERLWAQDGDAFRRVFFSHRDVLFPTIEEAKFRLPLPFLFAGAGSDPAERRLLTVALDGRKAQRDAEMSTSLTKPGIDKAKIVADFKAVASFLALRFVDRNPALRALLDEGTPTFAKVASSVSAATPQISIFDEFLETGTETNASGEIDPALRSKVTEYSTMLKGFFRDGLAVSTLSAADTGAHISPLTLAFDDHLENLLELRSLTYDAYAAALAELYTVAAISNVSTTFWCTRCHDDTPVLTAHSRISPTHLRMKCIKCQKVMAAGSLYRIDSLLHDCIYTNDGLLGVAIGWLLEKHHRTYRSGDHVQGRELDFRFRVGDREILLECKMHKSKADAETTTQHFVQAINQIARQAQLLRERGERVDAAWIVTNHDVAALKDEVGAALTKCATKVTECAIEVVDACDVPRRVDAAQPKR